jgi:hypothetical protein
MCSSSLSAEHSLSALVKMESAEAVDCSVYSGAFVHTTTVDMFGTYHLTESFTLRLLV